MIISLILVKLQLRPLFSSQIPKTCNVRAMNSICTIFYNLYSFLQSVLFFTICTIFYNLYSFLQSVLFLTICTIFYNLYYFLQSVHFFTICTIFLQSVLFFTICTIFYNLYFFLLVSNNKLQYSAILAVQR